MIYSPQQLAQEWGCSVRHIRDLINRGELTAFRAGKKIFRIPAEAVGDYICRNHTQLADTADVTASSTTTRKANGTVKPLEPLTRQRLKNLRQSYTQR